jgi:hypothetical protein
MRRLKRPLSIYVIMAFFAACFRIERVLIRWGIIKGWEDEDYSDFGI